MIGLAMEGLMEFSYCIRHVQAGVLWRRRINVGDVRHRLIANYTYTILSRLVRTCCLPPPKGRGEDAVGRY